MEYIFFVFLGTSGIITKRSLILFYYFIILSQSAPQVLTAGLIIEEVYVIGMEGAAILLSMEFVWMEEVEEV